MLNSFPDINPAKYVNWQALMSEHAMTDSFVMDNVTHIAATETTIVEFFHRQFHTSSDTKKAVFHLGGSRNLLSELMKRLISITVMQCAPDSHYGRYKAYYLSPEGRNDIILMSSYVDIGKFIQSICRHKADPTMALDAIDVYTGDVDKQRLISTLIRCCKTLSLDQYKHIDSKYKINSGSHINWTYVCDKDVVNHYIDDVGWTDFFHGKTSAMESIFSQRRVDHGKLKTAICNVTDYVEYLPRINHMCASNLIFDIARYTASLNDQYTETDYKPLLDVVDQLKDVEKVNWSRSSKMPLHPAFIDQFVKHLEFDTMYAANRNRNKSTVIATYNAVGDF